MKLFTHINDNILHQATVSEFFIYSVIKLIRNYYLAYTHDQQPPRCRQLHRRR